MGKRKNEFELPITSSILKNRKVEFQPVGEPDVPKATGTYPSQQHYIGEEAKSYPVGHHRQHGNSM